MLGLLLCALLAEWFQPGVVTQARSAVFTRSERTYKASPDTVLGQILIALFRIGTVGMALCMCLCADMSVTFGTYALICGIVLGVLLAKMFCNMLIDYTFGLSRRADTAYEHYADTATLAVLVLFPVLLVVQRIGTPRIAFWCMAAVSLLFLVMWYVRSWRLFASSPLAAIYVTLYNATLEVLPLVLVYYLSAKTISII